MRTLLHWINPNNWSIRQRLAFVLILMLFVPLLVTYVVLEAGSQERDQQMTEDYVDQVAQERLDQINTAVGEATGILDELVNNLRYRRDLINLFEGEATRETRRVVGDFLYDRLVQTGYYIDIRVLNSDGLVVANTITPRSSTLLTDRDLSDTPGYKAGREAQLLNDDQRIVVYTEDNKAFVDVAQVLYYSDRSLGGFVVATMNLDNVLIRHLNSLNRFIPIYSYLTTADGMILTLPDAYTLAEQSRNRSDIQAGLSSEGGIRTYRIGEDQWTAHLAPVENTRFTLVTETISEIPLTSPLDVFVDGNGMPLLALLLASTILLIVMLNWTIVAPLGTLREAVQEMSKGNYLFPVRLAERQDEIGVLSQSFVNLREQVRQTIEDLEGRMADRVRDLQATQEVSRFAATQRDLQRLMDEVVNLILSVFPNIYHAQIFLLDSENQFAVLRASTGEAGMKLLERGHRLAVGSVSVIGQVTGEGRTVIARDTAVSGVHRRNEFLPDTRSEAAIPLRVGERIIGALDVQSRQDNSFDEDQVTILQIMADQIAISLDNARLYQESLRRLEQIAESSREQTFSAWEEHMYARRTQAMVAEVGIDTGIDNSSLREQAMQSGSVAVGERTDRQTIPFAVPIKLRAQVLGAVEWELPLSEYSYEKVLLAEELVSRLAISLDNARLFEQSQRATERERVVNTIAARIAGQTSIDDILQTAIREVGQALRVPEVNIRLSPGSQDSNTNGHQPASGSTSGSNGHHTEK